MDNVLALVLDVFDGISSWFIDFIPRLTVLFWEPGLSAGDPGNLTFLGVLACAGLGLSIIFLCLGVISNFLHFRGFTAFGNRKSKIIDHIFGFFGSRFNLAA